MPVVPLIPVASISTRTHWLSGTVAVLDATQAVLDVEILIPFAR